MLPWVPGDFFSYLILTNGPLGPVKKNAVRSLTKKQHLYGILVRARDLKRNPSYKYCIYIAESARGLVFLIFSFDLEMAIY